MKPTYALAVLLFTLPGPTRGHNETQSKPVATPKTIHCSVMTDKVVDVAMATKGGDYADYKGRRYFFCCGYCPGEFKKNPDKYVANESIPTPSGTPAPVEELTQGTIIAAYWSGAPTMPDLLRKHPPTNVDVILLIKEYLPDLPHTQLKRLLEKASHDFVLRAADHPDVKLTLADFNFNRGDGKIQYQGFGGVVDQSDRPKLVAGVDYLLVPVQPGPKKLWKEDKKIRVRYQPHS